LIVWLIECLLYSRLSPVASLKKGQRVKCEGHVLKFYLLRLRMELRIHLSNDISIKSFSDYLKKKYIDTVFHLGVKWCLLSLLGYGPSILLNDQFISIHTRINWCQCFSTVMILCSIRKLVFISRNRTRNGSFYYSMWLR